MCAISNVFIDNVMFSTNVLNIIIFKNFIQFIKNVKNILFILFLILNIHVNISNGYSYHTNTGALSSRTYYDNSYGVTSVKSVNMSLVSNVVVTSGSTISGSSVSSSNSNSHNASIGGSKLFFILFSSSLLL